MNHIYEARINRDLTEGRGPMITVGFFSNEYAALSRVKGQDTQGTDGQVIQHALWVSLEEQKEFEAARIIGLLKLTPLEKRALGINL